MTLREGITEAVAAGITRRDAETLLLHVVGCDRAFLLAHGDDALGAEALGTLRSFAARRAAREPLQYIVGTAHFYGLEMRVTPAVLIPRPETELLVEAVLLWTTGLTHTSANDAIAERTLRIADIGTGSGAIPIALATHLAGARFLATDISSAALQVARENAVAHGCEERITFAHADLLTPIFDGAVNVTSPDDQSLLSAPLDILVSNPPYVPLADRESLQPEVVEHEPHTALFAEEDGLAMYRRLIPLALGVLAPGGLLALEIGYGQQDALAALLEGWQNVRFLPDLQGIARVALAERP